MRSGGALAAFLLGLSLPALAGIALNPDVRPDTLAETICSAGYTRTVRPSTSYTNGVKKKLLREEGREASDAAAYELDHIVPLALGGHPRALANLMLQPWEGSAGAKRKDRLEVKMQCLVCSGQLALEDAQNSIYADWQGAYRRYAALRCQRRRNDQAATGAKASQAARVSEAYISAGPPPM